MVNFQQASLVKKVSVNLKENAHSGAHLPGHCR